VAARTTATGRCAATQALREMVNPARGRQRIAAVNEDLVGLSANVISRLSAERAVGERTVRTAVRRLPRRLRQRRRHGGHGRLRRDHGRRSLRNARASDRWLPCSRPGRRQVRPEPVSIDERIAFPRTNADDAFWTKFGDTYSEEDLVLLMDVLVSKEGRVTGMKMLKADNEAVRAETAARRDAIKALSSAILNARLQPAEA
jgi:hypothetical protein